MTAYSQPGLNVVPDKLAFKIDAISEQINLHLNILCVQYNECRIYKKD